MAEIEGPIEGPIEAAERARPALLELVEVFARLRRECAWKAAQTHRSLTRYLIEESYEAVEAIEVGSPDELRDELGDVLLQVYLHAAIAAETGEFDIEDVAAGLRDKMIRRNPHVFGAEDGPLPTDPEQINARWQQIKAVEKRDRRTDLLDGVPEQLPALLRADKLIERAAHAGRPLQLDPKSADLGERLLSVVAEARESGIDPEQALRETIRRHRESHLAD